MSKRILTNKLGWNAQTIMLGFRSYPYCTIGEREMYAVIIPDDALFEGL